MHRGRGLGVAAHHLDPRLLHGRPGPRHPRDRPGDLLQSDERIRLRRRTGAGLPHGAELVLDDRHRPARLQLLVLPAGHAAAHGGGAARHHLPAGCGGGPLRQRAGAPAHGGRDSPRRGRLPRHADSGDGDGAARRAEQRVVRAGRIPRGLHGDRLCGAGVLLRDRRHPGIGVHRPGAGRHHDRGRGLRVRRRAERRRRRTVRSRNHVDRRRPGGDRPLGHAGHAGLFVLVPGLRARQRRSAARHHQVHDEPPRRGRAPHVAGQRRRLRVVLTPVARHRAVDAGAGRAGRPSRTGESGRGGAAVPAVPRRPAAGPASSSQVSSPRSCRPRTAF